MAERVPGAEGPEREWKRSPPQGGRLAKTLCAFANGAGGLLSIGVADDGAVVGVADATAVERAVAGAAARLEPAPRVTTRRLRREGLVVVLVRVAAAADRPVAVLDASGRRRVYVREGSRSRPASAGEVKALGRAARAGSIDEASRRVLGALAGRRDGASLRELPRLARMGPRATKRAAMALLAAGLVLEREDGRLWITPSGHRRRRV